MSGSNMKKIVLSALVCITLVFGTTLPIYATENNVDKDTVQEITNEPNDPNLEDSFSQEPMEKDLSLPSEDKSSVDLSVTQNSSDDLEEDQNMSGKAEERFTLSRNSAFSGEASEETLVVNEDALLAAVAAREPVIELAGSFDITGTITIDAGYEVVIVSDDAGPHALHRAFSTGALFNVQDKSNFTLQQVVLDGQNISSSGSLVVASKQSTVTLNAGAVLKNNNTTLHGGGIFAEGGSVVVLNEGCRIENNAASELGGGVYVGKDATKLYMHGGTITENISVKSGGGIAFATGSEGYISGGEISKNGASKGFGGGLSIGGSVEFSNASLLNNYAQGGGGGVFNSTQFTMTGGSISGNYLTAADGNGGGIWAELAANTAIIGGVIGGDSPADANKAKSGGGLYVEGFQPGSLPARTIVSGNAVIKGNEASYMGGGMLVVYPDGLGGEDLRSTEISGNAQITHNTAQHAAGVHIALYSKYGNVDVSLGGNATIAHNQATGQGGGLYLGGVEATITDTFTISNNTAQYGGGIRLMKGNSYPPTSLSLADEVSVTGNTAALGGGICVTSGATLETSGTVSLVGNTGGTGAGLFIMGSTAALGGSTTVGNNNATLGEESDNTAGAVYVARGNIGTSAEPVYEPGVLNVSENVIIENNTAGKETGGIYLDVGTVMNLSGSAMITGNVKVGSASGIAVNEGATLNVWDTPQVGTNDADNGIYLASGMAATIPAGQDLNEGARLNFDGLGDGASEGALVAQREDGIEAVSDESVFMFYTAGGYTVVKDKAVASHYVLKEATYTVTYHDNDAEVGDVPVDETTYKQGDTVTILEKPDNLTIKGMTFLGWGLSADQEDEPLKAGDTLEVTDADINLYALWELDSKIGPQDPDDPDPAIGPGDDLDDRSGTPDPDDDSNAGTGSNSRSSTDNGAGNAGSSSGADSRTGSNLSANTGAGNGPSSMLAKTYDSVPSIAIGLIVLVATITLAMLLRRKHAQI